MTRHDDRGMATAEYAVGTIGAAVIGTILFKLGAAGMDGPWFDHLFDMVREALEKASHIRVIGPVWPRLGFGRR